MSDKESNKKVLKILTERFYGKEIGEIGPDDLVEETVKINLTLQSLVSMLFALLINEVKNGTMDEDILENIMKNLVVSKRVSRKGDYSSSLEDIVLLGVSICKQEQKITRLLEGMNVICEMELESKIYGKEEYDDLMEQVKSDYKKSQEKAFKESEDDLTEQQISEIEEDIKRLKNEKKPDENKKGSSNDWKDLI